MKNRNTFRSILLVALLSSVSVCVASPIANDTVPPPVHIHISVADLPALLNGEIVGITLEQMDSLTVNMIDCDGYKERAVLAEGKLDTALIEVYKRDVQIQDLTVLDDFNKREVAGKDILIREQDLYISIVEKDLKKEKRKSGLWKVLTGLGTGAGIAFGIWISN